MAEETVRCSARVLRPGRAACLMVRVPLDPALGLFLRGYQRCLPRREAPARAHPGSRQPVGVAIGPIL